MSKAYNECTRNGLETQQQQEQKGEQIQQINVEKNDKEIKSQTEQSTINANSENAKIQGRRRRENKNSNSGSSKRNKSQNNATTIQKTATTATTTSTTSTAATLPVSTTSESTTPSNLYTPTIPATQFSVQRSDTDGLRMRISAIRPNQNNLTATTTATTTKDKHLATTITSSLIVSDRVNNNNTIKVKISNKQQQQQQSEVTLLPSIGNSLLSSLEYNLQHQVATTTGTATTTASRPNMETANTAVTSLTSTTATTTSTTTTNFNSCHTTSIGSSSLISTMMSSSSPQVFTFLSDATESGLSEATTTTVAAAGGNEKAAKRVKLKRKKAQSKSHESKRSLKKSRQQNIKTTAFSSDSDDDDVVDHHHHHHPHHGGGSDNRLKPIVQRAPRLLLTAINSKSSLPQIKTLLSTTTSTTTTTTTEFTTNKPLITTLTSSIGANIGVSSDNIGLSSSDNELPDLVNAAIKRVESDTDDTTTAVIGGISGGNRATGSGNIGGSSFRRSKIKHLQQYQSTLLQDFMEKTQMLATTKTPSPQTTTTATTATTLKQPLDLNSADSIASSSGENSIKKRRGRPKKSRIGDLLLDDLAKPISTKSTTTTSGTTTTTTTQPSTTISSININESVDSGVISTQSTSSPSSKILLNCTMRPSNQHHRQHTKQRKQQIETNTLSPSISGHHNKQQQLNTINPSSTSSSSLAILTSSLSSRKTNPIVGSSSTTSNLKPKIDIAYLDKRMYATERVLYPPPRNKRRQSMSALTLLSSPPISSNNKDANVTTTTATTTTTTTTKEELDPVWRKIDVNKKFRRPSLSGYKSDGGGGNTTICSKILAAKCGYVSDYGSSFIVRSSHHHHHNNKHNSGYKSDASCKSRYSVKSCISRRSRAKSCGYRSDCKESLHGGAGGNSGGQKSTTKFRRKRRCSTLFTRSGLVGGSGVASGNPNDEQDILQLAGLSLGQSSEESNEYVCKPNLDSLPSTSVSKKYGEINRFIATGEYFGRGSSGSGVSGVNSGATSFAGLTAKRLYEFNKQVDEDTTQDIVGGSGGSGVGVVGGTSTAFSNNKLQVPRKVSLPVDELTTQDLLPHTSRKIKSRRSSAASYCSSYYSGVSKIRRRKRRKSFRCPSTVVDSKLLTEIDILTNTFGSMCRIQVGGGNSNSNINVAASNNNNTTAAVVQSSTDKDKLLNVVAFGSGNTSGNGNGNTAEKIQQTTVNSSAKRESRDKRSQKKRKMSENLDFALLSAAANAAAAASGGGGIGSTPSSGGGNSTGKRRHKKTNSSSPDDHKLPLKKRHYLLTPGEKSAATEAAVAAVATKLYASNTEAWAAAAAAAKSTVTAKAQQQQQQAASTTNLNTTMSNSGGSGVVVSGSGGASGTSKGGKTGLTPKKRHLLQNSNEDGHHHSHHHMHHHHGHGHGHGHHGHQSNNSSPLRIVVDGLSNSISGGKLLDISPLSLSAGSCSTKHSATTTAGGGGALGTATAEVNHKKRSRLEGLVTKIATAGNVVGNQASSSTTVNETNKEVSTKVNSQKLTPTTTTTAPQLDSDSTSCPPPGIFEPSVELEIQNITKLTEAAASIITKSEVDSPLLMEISKTFGVGVSNSTSGSAKSEGTRVIEALLNKTGANLILKRKRKKFNRTGFPTVRRKKRKIHEQLLLDVTPDISEQVQRVIEATTTTKQTTTKSKDKSTKNNNNNNNNKTNNNATTPTTCERVPQTGEASQSFTQRANHRTPRLSVVSLERLQGVSATQNNEEKTTTTATTTATPKSSKLAQRKGITKKQQEQNKEKAKTIASTTTTTTRKTKKPEASSETTLTTTTPRSRTRISKINAMTPTVQISKLKSTARKSSSIDSRLTPSNKKSLLTNTNTTNKASTITTLASTTTTTKSQSTAFTKSSVQKIITAKSLEAKVKLPAGIDPNTNFSCKIRLKRRNALFPQLSTVSKVSTSLAATTTAASTSTSNTPTTTTSKINNLTDANQTSISTSITTVYTSRPPIEEPDRPSNEIDAEAALKDPNINYIEHDILPIDECRLNVFEHFELANVAGDTSDEKSSSSSSQGQQNNTNNNNGQGGRKLTAPIKKNYLPAGLFSNYFKIQINEENGIKTNSTGTTTPQKKKDTKDITTTTTTPSIHGQNNGIKSFDDNDLTSLLPLLPPPTYCERYYRQELRDFQLPYDIYWAYTHNKLPKRNTVPSWQYRKIRTNIYADSVRPNLAGFDHPTCNCKLDNGNCGENCLNRMVYTECSPSNCPTREKCLNQKIQRHEVAPGVERFMTIDKGWGVRTKLPIKKGTYILEYVGEVVTEREFKDRMGLIYQNDTHHYCLHLDGGLVIDGHRMGSDGRFVNHSCMPNCEMQKWSVNGLSRMALFAARNIEPGEELTYDYNFSLINPSEGQPCRCNTPQCRGVIGGKSQRIKPLPIEVKANESPNISKDTVRNGRQRKRKASKNKRNNQSNEIALARVQQLTEKEKKIVKQTGIFLVRSFEKIRRLNAKRSNKKRYGTKSPKPTTTPSPTSSPNIVGISNNQPSNGNILSNNNAANNNATPTATTAAGAAASITNRRPSTPNPVAAQISALCSPRSIKTRGLTLAVQDPEIGKMAKMAVILRDICATLQNLKTSEDENQNLISIALSNNIEQEEQKSTNATISETTTTATTGTTGAAGTASNTTTSGVNNKKKKSQKSPKSVNETVTTTTTTIATTPTNTNTNTTAAIETSCLQDFKTLQTNIEQGFYKQPNQFDSDMQNIFNKARRDKDAEKLKALDELVSAYEQQKFINYKQLLEIIEDELALINFRSKSEKDSNEIKTNGIISGENVNDVVAVVASPTSTPLPLTPPPLTTSISSPTEDIIRCICGLHKDEGLMIQCARCMVWQHTECTKADVKAENYLCENCEPREVDREIPLEEFTEDGHRYYLSLMRGDLHIRQGDAVYVLRDIPFKDDIGNVVPMKKHTYETIGNIDYNECDIFRVESLWKNKEGKRFIFGHHFLRPHETFHEPTRRFYPNEVVRVPLYEVVPIELVIGRCWVLDRTTFCKGRPIECNDDDHCYICELRVDKTARFFSKAKNSYPTCTKSYAFRKFPEKLKISKTYAPHEVDPTMLKTKKQKTENEINSNISNSSSIHQNTCGSSNSLNVNETNGNPTKQEANNSNKTNNRKRQNSASPIVGGVVHLITPPPPTVQTVKERRQRLENVLKNLKLKTKMNQKQINNTEPIIDLSYLLSGRGARQRKTLHKNTTTNTNSITI